MPVVTIVVAVGLLVPILIAKGLMLLPAGGEVLLLARDAVGSMVTISHCFVSKQNGIKSRSPQTRVREPPSELTAEKVETRRDSF